MEISTLKKNDSIEFKYNNFKRYLSSIAFFVLNLLGVSFILIAHWFSILLGAILVIVSLHNLLDILFFKCLVIEDNYVIKKWFIFGERKVNIKNLKIGLSKRVWTGTISFSDKKKGFLSNSLMFFELFPIGNEGFKKMKKILIEKNILKGNENEWNC